MAGSGFDLTCTTFNSEGKLFQVEYAGKAIENSNTIVGLKCADGIIIGTDKMLNSKMMVHGTNKRIHHISKNMGCIITGNLPDGRHLVGRAREECKSYMENFGVDALSDIIADRVGNYMHLHTCYSGLRPFGASVMLISKDKKGAHLHMLDNSGNFYKYYGAAQGKGRQFCKSEIEKLDLKTLTVKEAVYHIAKMLHKSHDEATEKKFELEMSWISEGTNWEHQFVPQEIVLDEEQRALEAIEKEEYDD